MSASYPVRVFPQQALYRALLIHGVICQDFLITQFTSFFKTKMHHFLSFLRGNDTHKISQSEGAEKDFDGLNKKY